MLFRRLGKTDLKISAIGLGCENLDGKTYAQVESTINTALEHGVNILDVFMPGKEIRENIAKSLGNRRKDIIVQGHIGSTGVRQQYDISRHIPTVRRYFDDILRIFGGYIDLGMMFFIDSEEDYKEVFETEFVTYVEHLKTQGYIGHIGFSSHNPAMAIKVIKTGLPEMLMFSINPAFDMFLSEEHREDASECELSGAMDPKRAELYELCKQEQIGITAMKTLGAGKLILPEHTPFAKPLTVPQCIHYALSKPAVASALLGCQTADEVLDAVRYFEISESEKDYSASLGSTYRRFEGSCVYCNHCQPCPAGIDIAAVHKYLDIALLDSDNIPPSIRCHYSNLAHSGSDCFACGNCESRCPFNVPIIRNMEEAERILGENS